ncbi:hypothetical protein PTTG_09520 [Puccinia triticina 1-1 BBBD Race 1]|uniref:Uncharacterized protein n=1 Tax=Puccinia triticina (isolate 1-1 / race 1 (BBBD)) TaxID=630390 RepID=A0A180GES8_PUCT1|nr:hypothetical protein PTTG_09520 [Puccinia triticina 1-1 BBBD Race 1]
MINPAVPAVAPVATSQDSLALVAAAQDSLAPVAAIKHAKPPVAPIKHTKPPVPGKHTKETPAAGNKSVHHGARLTVARRENWGWAYPPASRQIFGVGVKPLRQPAVKQTPNTGLTLVHRSANQAAAEGPANGSGINTDSLAIAAQEAAPESLAAVDSHTATNSPGAAILDPQGAVLASSAQGLAPTYAADSRDPTNSQPPAAANSQTPTLPTPVTPPPPK